MTNPILASIRKTQHAGGGGDDGADELDGNVNRNAVRDKRPSVTVRESLNTEIHIENNDTNGTYSPARSMTQESATVAIGDLDSTSHKKRGGGILASERDVNMPEAEFAAGCTLLLACARGDIAMVERVLKQHYPKINVNFRDYDRRTALHVASSEGHLDLVKYLVNRGGMVNRSDRWGGSPLDDAHRHRYTEVASYLRSRGGKTGSSDLTTNLINAAVEGDVDEIQVLVDSFDVDVNRGDYDRRTALHLASGNDHGDVVKLLLDRGANPNAEDRWGGRPLDDALTSDASKVIPILKARGATVGRRKSSMDLVDRPSSGMLPDVGPDPDLDIDFKELEMIERIGSGAFGEIYKCRWRGTLVAAKCIKSAKITKEWKKTRRGQKQSISKKSPSPQTSNPTGGTSNSSPGGRVESEGTDESPEHSQSRRSVASVPSTSEKDLSLTTKEMALDDFRIEVAILKKLRHPNICLLLAYSTTADFEVMVSELMRCSLLDVFRANTGHANLSKKNKIVYAQQIAQGMNYLHTCKPPIIHRDLKPANILVDHTGTLKITDFGLAKVRSDPSGTNDQETDTFTMTGETGTYRYMAPEVFRHEQYSEKVDVYSFAMIVYILLMGTPPWPMLNGVAAARAAAIEGRRPAIPRQWDGRWSDLLQQCWAENPSERPPFREVLNELRELSQELLGTHNNSVVVVQQQRTGSGCSCTVS